MASPAEHSSSIMVNVGISQLQRLSRMCGKGIAQRLQTPLY
jgi:hypothetical protein